MFYSWYFQSEPMHKQQAVRGTSCCLFLCILTKVDLFQEWNAAFEKRINLHVKNDAEKFENAEVKS